METNLKIEPVTVSGKLFKYLVKLMPSIFWKKTLERLTCLFFRQNRIKLVEQSTGTIFFLNINDDITRQILLNNGYETLSVRLAIKLMKEGGWFLDVGANFGLYSCIISANRKVKTIAIEPFSGVIEQLNYHIKQNGLQNVTVINCCISDKEALIKFREPQNGNIGLGKGVRDNSSGFDYYQPALTIKKVCDWMNVTDLKLIKIDVEGMELNVLKSIDIEGSMKPQHIILEYLPKFNPSVFEIFNYLQKLGYTALTVEGDILTLSPKLSPIEGNLWFSLNATKRNEKKQS